MSRPTRPPHGAYYRTLREDEACNLLRKSAPQSDVVALAYQRGVRVAPSEFRFPFWEMASRSARELRLYFAPTTYLQFDDDGIELHAEHPGTEPSPFSPYAGYYLPSIDVIAARLNELGMKQVAVRFLALEEFRGEQEAPKIEPFDGERITFESEHAKQRAYGQSTDHVTALALLAALVRDPNADFVWAERRHAAMGILKRAGVKITHGAQA